MMFKPTQEQQKVLDWIKYGVGNAVIDAKAGSGKSTLIEYAIRDILERNSDEKVIYFAFNKDTVAKMAERFGFEFDQFGTPRKHSKYPNFKIVTCHSFGLSLLIENKIISSNEPNDYKYMQKFTADLDLLADSGYWDLSENEKLQYKSNIRKLIDYSRYNKDQKPAEILATSEKYGIIPILNEGKVVAKLLRWGSDNINEIDYCDMIWLPCELGLNTRKAYNFIFVDEAQDLSPIEQELALKSIDNRRGRIIVVGDKYQCINAWAGADVNAFNKYRKFRNMNEFLLSVCQRCSKNVIEKAQSIVPEIAPKEDAIDGKVEFNTAIDSPKNGDLVLCRFTIPLIEYYEYLLKRGKMVKIAGKDIMDKIVDYVSSCTEKTMGEVVNALYKRLFSDIKRKSAEGNMSEDDVIKYCNDIINEYDIIKTIDILSGENVERENFIENAEKIFSINPEDDRSSYIRLSTIHKSKGDEADNVFILCPSMLHSPMIRSDWEIAQEDNLEYVMITRAKKNLYYMEENAQKNFNLSISEKMKTDLNIKKKNFETFDDI